MPATRAVDLDVDDQRVVDALDRFDDLDAFAPDVAAGLDGG